MMDDKVGVDDIDVIDQQQQQHQQQQQVYSVYEPHYQQMHPLIFYEDTSGHQHHQLHHHHLHHSGLAAIAHHHWDHEHFGVRETCEIHNSNCIEKRIEDIKREDINNSISINHSDSDNDCNTNINNNSHNHNHHQQEQTVSSDETEGIQTGSQTPTNRELHNEIERRRRLRIKQCCDILRTLVPGLSEKTDKATVLEHTVKFVSHLSKCPTFKCDCQV